MCDKYYRHTNVCITSTMNNLNNYKMSVKDISKIKKTSKSVIILTNFDVF